MVITQVRSATWETVAVDLAGPADATEDAVKLWLEALGCDTAEGAELTALTGGRCAVAVYSAKRVEVARVEAVALVRVGPWCAPIFLVDSSDVVAGLTMLAGLAAFK